jgi:Rap1a immunity proteins
MPASAEDLNSANYFLPGCKGFLNREKKLLADEALMQGLCAGFVDGLVFGAAGKDICPPKGATRGQARAVVIKYIEARPERMHERFDVLAYEALIAAWPCKR